MKLLVLGAYGNFGARICRALAPHPLIELCVAGRDIAQARTLAQTLGGRTTAAALDGGASDLANAIQQLRADLVIHLAGPFQQQGYEVARAVAKAGAHYLDLADGRRFVCDFPQAVNEDFVRAGKTAITGASTVPALSSAVIEALSAGWQRIHSIDICIAPAQTAPRGTATMAAVLSYCGQAIPIWREGRWQTGLGWAAPTRVHFQRLRPRIGALCDIPDLELFPQRYQVRDAVMFRAALEVGATQRAFAMLARLRGLGLIPSPARWAAPLNRLAGLFDRLGSSLGGMVLRVEGIDGAGEATRRAWHITADHDHGPEIPCMPAILLARRLASGEAMAAGAFTAAGTLALAEFAPEFAKWGMLTDIIEEAPHALPDRAVRA